MRQGQFFIKLAASKFALVAIQNRTLLVGFFPKAKRGLGMQPNMGKYKETELYSQDGVVDRCLDKHGCDLTH